MGVRCLIYVVIRKLDPLRLGHKALFCLTPRSWKLGAEVGKSQFIKFSHFLLSLGGGF